jgi:hypothetical protein
MKIDANFLISFLKNYPPLNSFPFSSSLQFFEKDLTNYEVNQILSHLHKENYYANLPVLVKKYILISHHLPGPVIKIVTEIIPQPDQIVTRGFKTYLGTKKMIQRSKAYADCVKEVLYAKNWEFRNYQSLCQKLTPPFPNLPYCFISSHSSGFNPESFKLFSFLTPKNIFIGGSIITFGYLAFKFLDTSFLKEDLLDGFEAAARESELKYMLS